MFRLTRTTRRRSLSATAGLLLLLAAGATSCSTTEAQDRGSRITTGDGCAPIRDTNLVALADDRKMATAGNILPAVNANAFSPELIDALNRVSRSLDQSHLIGLNRATYVDRKDPATAAAEFVAAQNLTDGLAQTSKKQTIAIGVTDLTENRIIGYAYREVLNAAGFNAEVKTGVGNRDIYLEALKRGEQLHVVPEYLGELAEHLNNQLGADKNAALAYGDPDRAREALDEFSGKAGLKFGAQSEAHHQRTFAVTKAVADKYHLHTLSDLAEVCSGYDTALGGPSECPARSFCQAGLESVYDLAIGRFVALDMAGAVTRWGLTDGLVTVGLVLSSDPTLTT